MTGLGDPRFDLTPERAAELHSAGEIVLLDVREPHEHDAGRVAGAHHVPLARLAERAESLPRGRPLAFYCRVGARSALAAQAFRSAGFDAYNVSGGLQAWVARGLPIEPENGRVAEH